MTPTLRTPVRPGGDTPLGGVPSSPWLSGVGGVEHGRLNVQDYSPTLGLSVNSLDIESRHLVYGTDKDALYVYTNVKIR